MSLLGRRSPIGIDVNGRFINAVQIGRSVGRPVVEAAASVPRLDPTMPVDAAELARLTSLFDRQGFRGGEVVIAVPGERLISSVVEIASGVARAGLTGRARVELAAINKCEPDSLEVACWNLPKPAANDGTTEVLAVACRQDEANGMVDLFEAAGMDVTAIDVSSWAVTRACAPLVAGSAELMALLNLGWTAAELVVVARGVVAYERVLGEHGLNRLHSRLMTKLELDNDVTDHLLNEIGLRAELPEAEARSDLLATVQGYLTDHLGRIAGEVTKSLSYAAQEYGGRDLRRVLVHGEGAMVPGAADLLSSRLNAEAGTIAPHDVATCGKGLATEGGLPILMTALGLAKHTGG